jgi:ribonuclease VapC
MIVADTSSLIAVAFGEAERESFLATMRKARTVLVSSVSLVEARMVVHGRRGERGVILLDDMLRTGLFEIVPPSLQDADAAHAAFVTFGRGSGHPAALNFGDLFSYALAKTRNLPLLYKGEDFSQTDIQSAAVHGGSKGH